MDRRAFLAAASGAGVCAASGALFPNFALSQQPREQANRTMRFGLVTYLWGRDWDLPTLLANCQHAGVLGVELRTTHAHGVEPSLDAAQRREVRSRFDASPVTCVGLGSNERFDHPDPAELAKAIDAVKEFVRLSHDIGSSGVKVKPNDLPPDVPREKTIEQIGRALNEVGRFAAEHDQQIRLEVHGQCAELPIMRQIMDVADHPSVAVCWNSNRQDLAGRGLRYNFNLVKDRFGDTCHVHALDDGAYPYDQLLRLLVGMDYRGWVLLEASGEPGDRVAALARQRMLFDRMLLAARQ